MSNIIFVCTYEGWATIRPLHRDRDWLIVLIIFILWRAARKPEYLNLSGRPLLDNGSVTRFPVTLSGWQTRSRGNAYITVSYHGNESFNSGVSAVTNTLAAVVSEKQKTERFDKVFSTRLGKDCLQEMQTQIGTLKGDSRQSVKTDTDKSDIGRQLQ
jgi:hypothetical protein